MRMKMELSFQMRMHVGDDRKEYRDKEQVRRRVTEELHHGMKLG
jgi:hypothetical protein